MEPSNTDVRYTILLLMALVPTAATAQDGMLLHIRTPPTHPGHNTRDAERAVDAVRAGADKYLQEGDVDAAVLALSQVATALPTTLDVSHREPLARGLWLLADLLLNSEKGDRALALRALANAVRLAPNRRPGAVDFSATMLAEFETVEKRFKKSARRVSVRLAGDTDACSLWLDGRGWGPPSRTMGPVTPGTYQLALVCGPGPRVERRITVGADAVVVVVDAAELLTFQSPDGLAVIGEKEAAIAAEWLLRTTQTPWVAVIGSPAGSDLGSDHITPTLFRRGQQPITGGPMLLATAATWADGLERPEPDPAAIETVEISPAPRSSRWWHWTLVGAGAAIALTAIAPIVVAERRASTTNPGLTNSSAEIPDLNAAAGSLIGGGLSLSVVGLVLAIVGEEEDVPPQLSPAPQPRFESPE